MRRLQIQRNIPKLRFPHCLKMSAITLTKGAIAAISSGGATENDMKPVLQVAEIRSVNTQNNQGAERYRMLLSDGEVFQQAILAIQFNGLIKSEKLQKDSIVQLLHFVCHDFQDRKVIIIVAMDVILKRCAPIGQPKPYPMQKNGKASAAAVSGTCPKVEVGSATPRAPLINYEQSVSAARKEVFGIVDKIGGLTLLQKLMVSRTLVNNTNELELFLSLPGVARAEYARMMLAGEL